MRIPWDWLVEHVRVSAPLARVAEALTSAGLEVERVEYPGSSLSRVVVARVAEVERHPRAENLFVCRVDWGEGEGKVVVGAPVRPGQLSALALPGGATALGPVEAKEVRGVLSQGMLLAPDELGIGDDHSYIPELPGDLPLGADVREVAGVGVPVLEVDVTPNRPDCLSIRGVAREVAVLLDGELLPLSLEVPEGEAEAEKAAALEVLDSEGCPQYVARVVEGVGVGQAPWHTARRLYLVGMRPVNNVVDATNYVLAELGHPLHPFDLDRVAGRRVIVRRARAGETLLCLDGVERRLHPDDLVIADEERPIALAGVMGGEETGVGVWTRRVLLESAWFDPRTIGRTARRHSLRTEASLRFERGADPEVLEAAAARASSFILAWAGGKVARGLLRAGQPPARRRVQVDLGRISRLLGEEVDPDWAAGRLGKLGFGVQRRDSGLDVEVPPYRPDVSLEADIVEEIARVVGYDRLPSRIPPACQAGALDERGLLRRRLRRAALASGLDETFTSSFTSAVWLEQLGLEASSAVRLANPLSEEESVLRPSVLVTLLLAASRNMERRRERVALFELGRAFRRADGGVQEEEELAAVFSGGEEELHWDPGREEWHLSSRPLDLYDAAGAFRTLMAGLGVEFRWAGPAGGVFHPGRARAVVVAGEEAGQVGELHPRLVKQLGLSPGASALRLRLDPLLKAATQVQYTPAPRFPPVRFDLSFLLPEAVEWDQLSRELAGAVQGYEVRLHAWDLYRGPPVPEGEKSITLTVEAWSRERTLTSEEEASIRSTMIEAAARLGGRLRA